MTCIWCMNTISRTLALLKPADLFPAWKWIDVMEECGEIDAGEARRWKEGIYGLMVLWGLEPDEVLGLTGSSGSGWVGQAGGQEGESQHCNSH